MEWDLTELADERLLKMAEEYESLGVNERQFLGLQPANSSPRPIALDHPKYRLPGDVERALNRYMDDQGYFLRRGKNVLVSPMTMLAPGWARVEELRAGEAVDLEESSATYHYTTNINAGNSSQIAVGSGNAQHQSSTTSHGLTSAELKSVIEMVSHLAAFEPQSANTSSAAIQVLEDESSSPGAVRLALQWANDVSKRASGTAAASALLSGYPVAVSALKGLFG